METVTVGDIDVRYRTSGEGRPLVLIRGFTSSMEEWDPLLVDELSEKYRVLVFDNRGAGKTWAPPGDFSIRQFADDTAGLMEALGTGSGHVLGVSMGGMIAQEVAINHPEMVDKLVLCCTFCGGSEALFPTQEVVELMADRSGSQEDITRRNLPLLFPRRWIDENREQVEALVERSLLCPIQEENAMRQFEAILGFSTYDRLPSIDIPTLVACGTEDVIIPPVNSEIIAERIPGSKLVRFDGAGHGLIEQCRKEFLAELIPFLGD